METRIRVQCPHCGAGGVMMLPSMLSIIIGSCPKCNESVLVFCGRVLALDTALMDGGSPEEQRDHVLAVITKSLSEWMDTLIERNAEYETGLEQGHGAGQEEPNEFEPAGPEGTVRTGFGPITDDEVDRFVRIDLELLDREEYFRSVFDAG